MRIRPGQDLLHYRVVDKIGEGGMSVVWRAVDTALDREVAIKVLPESLATDPDRLARFEREARLLGSLSHPNIAVVHGLHRVEGPPDASGRFLALELLGGEDLSRRLGRGRLPIDEALRFARDIAAGLEAAHDSGVIHRDLKPANVQILPDDGVKVLDFGLAKAFDTGSEDSAPDPAASPTLTSLGTVAGTILGTAAYMSPEQAKGRKVDRRADVWAFGAVLFEMLAGRPAFLRDTVPETLAAVLKDEPEWERLPPGTPAPVRRLLRRCLAKAPRARLRDIGDARLVLDEVLDGVDAGESTSPPRGISRGVRWALAAPWFVAIGLAVAWIAAGSTGGDAGRRHGSTIRLDAALDDGAAFLANLDLEIMPALALSRAGDRLVYVALDPEAPALRSFEARHLMSRAFDASTATVVRGSQGAEGPFLSADGGWIGFFDGGRVLKVPVQGGATVEIADGVGNGVGADWGDDGTVVFAHSYVGPLWVVSADGGPVTALTTLGSDELSHRYPQWLPDGRSVLFTIKPSGILTFDDARIAIADRETGEHRVLPLRGTYARYVGSGHLVFGRDGALYAAPFDLDRLEIAGGAVPVVDGVEVNPTTGAALFDVSDDGTLVYVAGDGSTGSVRLSQIRADGSRRVLAAGTDVTLPRLAPDGSRLVAHGPTANDTVVLVDVERDTVLRLTDARSNDIMPCWGPHGDSVVFTTDRTGEETIVEMPAGGGPVETLIPSCGEPQDVSDISRDGRRIAINRGVRSARDVWIRDEGRSGKPVPFLTSPYNEGDAVFSPDGGWIAFSSDETGSSQVFLVPYPGPGGKVQVSEGDGAFYPRWSADGTTIYYQTSTGIRAVPVTFGRSPRPGKSRRVVSTDSRHPVGFDVARDSTLFYVAELDESRWQADRIRVVIGWSDELRRLVPTGR